MSFVLVAFGGAMYTTGRFTLTMGNDPDDPEGYRSMRADEMLNDMYGNCSMG